MWILIGASLLVLAATFADRLPLLHRLPLLGSAKPSVTFRVNGSDLLVVRLVPSEAGQSIEPTVAQIEVGIKNPGRQRIDQALINFALPIGLLREKTDHSGVRREDGGEWMPPTPERVGPRAGPFDYWAQDHCDFPSRSASLLYFNASFSEPGEYPIRLRISAPALYAADYDTDGLIRVEEVEHPGPVERLTSAIAHGEELLGELPDMTDEGRPREAMEFLLRARRVVDDEYPEGTPMLEADPIHAGSRSTAGYYVALVEADLIALYEIRRQLGSREAAWAREYGHQCPNPGGSRDGPPDI